MIEIFSETAFGNRGFKVARGRRHDAHIDRDLGAAADTLEGLVDEHAQNLVLCFTWQIRDVVDKKRAAVCFFERTGLAAFRAVGTVDAE